MKNEKIYQVVLENKYSKDTVLFENSKEQCEAYILTHKKGKLKSKPQINKNICTDCREKLISGFEVENCDDCADKIRNAYNCML